MILKDIQQIIEDPQIPVTIENFYEHGDYLVINNYTALKVVSVSNSYKQDDLISITNETTVFGDLIFTKCKNYIKIDEMNEYEFIAFLTHATFSDWSKENYKFECDFLLIKFENLSDYINNYKETSMLWGGFSHPPHDSLPYSIYKKSYTNIDVGIKLEPFENYSYESCIRAIEQPYAFERFLKLYHLLELQFDYFIIEKIKSLTMPADSNKIGKILNEYSHREIDRLTEIVSHHCTDLTKLENALSKISTFPIIAEDMFMNFGKSTSRYHLPDLPKFHIAVTGNNFTLAFLALNKIHTNDTIDHQKFIIGLTSYWIYRMRCSIAHNKIGEYLLSWNDENFIVEFGEPLLKEVLMQCFKK